MNGIHGTLEMGIVMISQTVWNAAMMVVIAVDHMSTHNFALNVSVLVNQEILKNAQNFVQKSINHCVEVMESLIQTYAN